MRRRDTPPHLNARAKIAPLFASLVLKIPDLPRGGLPTAFDLGRVVGEGGPRRLVLCGFSGPTLSNRYDEYEAGAGVLHGRGFDLWEECTAFHDLG